MVLPLASERAVWCLFVRLVGRRAHETPVRFAAKLMRAAREFGGRATVERKDSRLADTDVPVAGPRNNAHVSCFGKRPPLAAL